MALADDGEVIGNLILRSVGESGFAVVAITRHIGKAVEVGNARFARLQFAVALRYHAKPANAERVQVEIGVASWAGKRFDGMVPASAKFIQDCRVEVVHLLAALG